MNPTTLKLRRTGKLVLLLTVLCTGQLFGMEPEWSLPNAEHISQLPKEVQQTIINSALAASNTLPEAINAIKSASVMYGIRYDMLNKDALMHALTKKFPDKVKEEISVAIEKLGTYQKIVAILDQKKNFINTVETIEKEELLQDNLKDFTALVHILANQFNTSTSKVADSFATPLAKKYIGFGDGLINNVSHSNITEATRITEAAIYINAGADINYIDDYHRTPLIDAIIKLKVDLVKLLLNAGANPNLNVSGKTALDKVLSIGCDLYDYTEDEELKLQEIKTLLEEAMKNW